MKEAALYEKLTHDRVRCLLCAHRCILLVPRGALPPCRTPVASVGICEGPKKLETASGFSFDVMRETRLPLSRQAPGDAECLILSRL
jgi:hypothetical protein